MWRDPRSQSRPRRQRMPSQPDDAPNLALAPVRDPDARDLLALAAREDQDVHEPSFPELAESVDEARLRDRESTTARLLAELDQRELAARPPEGLRGLEAGGFPRAP